MAKSFDSKKKNTPAPAASTNAMQKTAEITSSRHMASLLDDTLGTQTDDIRVLLKDGSLAREIAAGLNVTFDASNARSRQITINSAQGTSGGANLTAAKNLFARLNNLAVTFEKADIALIKPLAESFLGDTVLEEKGIKTVTASFKDFQTTKKTVPTKHVLNTILATRHTAETVFSGLALVKDALLADAYDAAAKEAIALSTLNSQKNNEEKKLEKSRAELADLEKSIAAQQDVKANPKDIELQKELAHKIELAKDVYDASQKAMNDAEAKIATQKAEEQIAADKDALKAARTKYYADKAAFEKLDKELKRIERKIATPKDVGPNQKDIKKRDDLKEKCESIENTILPELALRIATQEKIVPEVELKNNEKSAQIHEKWNILKGDFGQTMEAAPKISADAVRRELGTAIAQLRSPTQNQTVLQVKSARLAEKLTAPEIKAALSNAFSVDISATPRLQASPDKIGAVPVYMSQIIIENASSEDRETARLTLEHLEKGLVEQEDDALKPILRRPSHYAKKIERYLSAAEAVEAKQFVGNVFAQIGLASKKSDNANEDSRLKGLGKALGFAKKELTQHASATDSDIKATEMEALVLGMFAHVSAAETDVLKKAASMIEAKAFELRTSIELFDAEQRKTHDSAKDKFHAPERNSITAQFSKLDQYKGLDTEAQRVLLNHSLKTIQDVSIPSSQIDVAIALARATAPKQAPVATDGRFITVPKGRINFDNANQESYAKMIDENKAVFATGPAGTKKTFIAVAKAVEALYTHDEKDPDRKRSIKQILFIRAPIANGKDTGFKPGTKEEKLKNFHANARSMVTFMIGAEQLEKEVANGRIVFDDGTEERGNTQDNTFKIIDEGQNNVREEYKMMLTRVGENSKLVVTGDTDQTDLKTILQSGKEVPKEYRSGLLSVVKTVVHSKRVDNVAHMQFTSADIVRSEFVRQVVDAFEADDKALQEMEDSNKNRRNNGYDRNHLSQEQLDNLISAFPPEMLPLLAIVGKMMTQPANQNGNGHAKPEALKAN